MIMDKLAEFCNAVSLVRATGSALIGNVIDLGVARDVGNGKPLYLTITIDTDVDSSGDAATVEFEVRSDSVAAIDPSTGTLHMSTGAIAQANLTQGKKFTYQLPAEGLAYERYLGIVQVTAGADVTAGKVNAFLTMDPSSWKAYPEGQN